MYLIKLRIRDLQENSAQALQSPTSWPRKSRTQPRVIVGTVQFGSHKENGNMHVPNSTRTYNLSTQDDCKTVAVQRAEDEMKLMKNVDPIHSRWYGNF